MKIIWGWWLVFYCGVVVASDSTFTPICVSIQATTQEALCTRAAEGVGQWWVRKAGQPDRPLPRFEVALSGIADLQVNPTGRWLAVVSVGEGHPWLELFDLAAVLRGQAVQPLYSLNPYPGFVNLSAWHGEELWLESDRDLRLYPLPFGVEPELATVGRFALRLHHGTWRAFSIH